MIEDLLSYYGIVLKTRKPYRTQTKVKNVVGYLKKNFMPHKNTFTLGALDNVRDWLKQTANRKPNGRTTKASITKYQVEEKYLGKSNTIPSFIKEKATLYRFGS